jgi:hypothetical protein
MPDSIREDRHATEIFLNWTFCNLKHKLNGAELLPYRADGLDPSFLSDGRFRVLAFMVVYEDRTVLRPTREVPVNVPYDSTLI